MSGRWPRITSRQAALRTIALVVVALLVAGCYPESPTPTGRQIRSLYDVFFWGGAFVVVLVWVLLAIVVVRYRRRDDRIPRQVHGYLPLQVAWVAIPGLVLAVLFVLTLQVMTSVQAVSDTPGVRVHVWAFRWQWRFDYPDEDITVVGTTGHDPELVVPLDTPIHVTLDSVDVAHSFYVPAFLFKRDAIPGLTNRFDFTVDEAGTYRGQCAELCGVLHTSMTFSVRAVPMADYQAWLDAQPRGALPTPPTLVGPHLEASP